MSKITIQKDSTLLVPDVPTVPYITGDGVGAEVTPSMQIIVDAAVRKAYGGKRHIEWLEVPAGERAFNETGSWKSISATWRASRIIRFWISHFSL